MTRLSPFALAGALLATSLTVIAASPVQAAARHVSYADLDLTSAAGRSVMAKRIRNAAANACQAENRDLTLAAACSRDSVTRADVSLNQAMQDRAVQMAAR